MTAIMRYIKLYGKCISFSASKGLEFRFDFYMRIFMDLLFYAVQILFYKVLFLHSATIGGWNESQAMVFISGYLLIDAINMTLFSNNMWLVPQMINKGDLDYHLIRPVSALFMISVRDFAFNSLINLLFALGIFIWSIGNLVVTPSIFSILLYLVLIFNGALIFYTLNMMGNLIVFWSQSADSFGHLVWQLMKFAERPDQIYSGVIRKILISILPFAIMTSFPARILLNGFSWSILGHCFLVSGIFVIALVSVWKIGLKSYSSASS